MERVSRSKNFSEGASRALPRRWAGLSISTPPRRVRVLRLRPEREKLSTFYGARCHMNALSTSPPRQVLSHWRRGTFWAEPSAKMRATSLVRYWLYGFGGFVVMTTSLAIAFSVAITGPPTDTEIRIARTAFHNVTDAIGQEMRTTVVELCPDLPPEVQAICASPAQSASQPTPPPAQSPQTDESPPVEIAESASAPGSSQQLAASEAQLLGGSPAPQRVERPRERRVAARRSARRDVAQPAPRPRASVRDEVARTAPPARQIEPVTSVRHGANAVIDDSAVQEDLASLEEEQRYQEWRERRRERRRRYYERRYEPPADSYYDDWNPPLDAQDELADEEAWPSETEYR